MDEVRVGVVGVGHLGVHHARIYSELPGCTLTGISDINEKNGARTASKYGTRFFEDYRGLIPEVDAVSIVTPTETHHSIALDFLKKGINTLVEKPVTNNPAHAEELIAAAEENGCILQVGHVERFNGAVKKAGEYIKNPRFIEVNRLSQFPARSLDIGVVLDLMIHDIDIILSFVKSPVKDIVSIGSSVFSGKEDIANCRIVFENGCVANVTASRISYKSERKFRVFEADRYVSLDYEKQELVVYRKKKEQVLSPMDVQRMAPRFRKTEPLREELRDFIKCVSTSTPPMVSGHSGLTALRLALEIAGKI